MENGEYFSSSEPYILMNVESGKYNYIHDEITGKTCILEHFHVGERGWLSVDYGECDVPWYSSVYTSPVLSILVSDDEREVQITTKNSVYHFFAAQRE